MTKIHHGRFTAEVEQDFIVFMIGMRVNQWWKIHKWLPIAIAMPRMLVLLSKQKELGMLAYEQFFRLFPLTTTLVSYWDSFDKLEGFANNKDLPHVPAWANFMKKVGQSGSVGIYHETYRIKKADFECIYGNMPRFGLAAAFKHVPVSKPKDRARERISQKL